MNKKLMLLFASVSIFAGVCANDDLVKNPTPDAEVVKKSRFQKVKDFLWNDRSKKGKASVLLASYALASILLRQPEKRSQSFKILRSMTSGDNDFIDTLTTIPRFATLLAIAGFVVLPKMTSELLNKMFY